MLASGNCTHGDRDIRAGGVTETDMETMTSMMKMTMKTATTITMKMKRITMIWRGRERKGEVGRGGRGGA